jgi:dolichol-phosphate mannosyltransferase
MQHPELSLVIPTCNERASIAPLVEELDAALGSLAWEAVFVDDSTDGTDALLAELGKADSRIRLLHRAVNRDGLAGAVVDGLVKARGAYICVMDADLQHPPARIPELLATARESGADLVIASRYVPGGSTGGLQGPLRQLYSRGLRQLALWTFPRRLGQVTDPLGGYFVLRRAIIDGVQLRPIGYKILLELLVRCQWRNVREVAYAFEPRRLGTSKASFRQGVWFLQHLARLARDCSPSLRCLKSLGTAAYAQGQMADDPGDQSRAHAY